LEKYNGQVIGGKTLNLNIDSIREKNNELNKEIVGSVSKHINSRLVMTDKELSKILKIKDDKERKKKFSSFVSKIQRESLTKLNIKLRTSIENQGQAIRSEANARLNEIDRSLTDMMNSLTQLIENKKNNQAKTDKIVSDLIYKRTLCDFILKEIGEDE
jgi:glycine cleavage system regulatory protein